ncbi:hypothetical protein CJ213_02090 [Gardnerella swidsinskii]|jgi:hypothetical protein|uniref:DUF3137 domain-containing protein n=1 Tax=Gardnerella swidsinskii TaxID=2792979 RepID=A0A9X7FEZ0_9BIFI|nr:DUF3137 domain-containing protein [Gardnerella swidsinskii]MDK8692149.1 DUF3137 domain-containing protein [Gardnerella swidsinskii]NSX40745.1 DUF3137 domain-containing protein [Gardnerella vaginalis]PMC54940.1 hypothetical protein CJ213_02090 [Gardnerella swidsinskii]UQA88504.1 DUF3137 domain-containing protein [Gardnerella swidsinskii]
MNVKYGSVFTNPEVLNRLAQIEQSPQIQGKLSALKEDVKNNSFDPIRLIPLIPVVMVLGTLYNYFPNIDYSRYKYYLLIVGVFVVCFAGKFFVNNKVDVDALYADNVLTPILNVILPGTVLNNSEGIDSSIFDNLLPISSKYYSSKHIIFGDEFRTEFSNMQAIHFSRSESGKSVKKTDFVGQVLLINAKTNINGHIRIVPVTGKNFMGKKLNGYYGRKTKEESEVQTESIEFNNSYSIFSTDDFYTKLVLDPSFIELMNNLQKRMRVCIYLDSEHIIAAFDSGWYLFGAPGKSGVENLSLTREYARFRDVLAEYYEIINVIREKLQK